MREVKPWWEDSQWEHVLTMVLSTVVVTVVLVGVVAGSVAAAGYLLGVWGR